MIDITNVLFWISTGLLIPVIVLLLFDFGRSLILLGGFFGMYIHRMKYEKKLQDFLKNIKNITVDLSEIEFLKGNKLFYSHLKNIMEHKDEEVFAEKILSDFEIAAEKDMSKSKSLAKIGPMLGLMGTLIPMGPALVDLASGNIAGMAYNMQVAFSTTVVGLFSAGIGYITQLLKQRWYTEDLNNLEFIYRVMKQEVPTKEIRLYEKESISQ